MGPSDARTPREWYSVKGLFRWYFKDGGHTARIEERVVLLLADSFDQALCRAESEGRTYCEDNPEANYSIEPTGWWEAYWIGEEPTDGVEVFSRCCKTTLSSKAFVRRYYPSSHDL